MSKCITPLRQMYYTSTSKCITHLRQNVLHLYVKLGSCLRNGAAPGDTDQRAYRRVRQTFPKQSARRFRTTCDSCRQSEILDDV